jgi:hypothetical protein
MNTNTLTTRTGKQFLGAVGGMAAATAIYLIIQQFSALNLQGALVETVPMSDNPQQIRVSDKNIDDEALAVLQRRARQVTAALGQTQSSASQPSVLAENSAYRRQVRLTAANLAVRVPSSAATTVAATTASSTTVSSEATAAVAQSAPLHSGAPLEQTPTAAALPSSGLGTQALALVSRRESMTILGDLVERA